LMWGELDGENLMWGELDGGIHRMFIASSKESIQVFLDKLTQPTGIA